MKRPLILLCAVLAIFLTMIAFFNMEVTTRQGVNYKWHTTKIPLYLKVLDFFDRHYNYGLLSKRITAGAGTEEERFLRVFKWANANIRRVPDGLPIVDDHVWSIIVRGYGARDQVSDVFTTLCNYAGMNAFYSIVRSADGKHSLPLSFVKVDGRWTVCDPYAGIYFINRSGNLADISDMRSKAYSVKALAGGPTDDYSIYTDCLKMKEDMDLNRASIQSPWARFYFECKMTKNRVFGHR